MTDEQEEAQEQEAAPEEVTPRKMSEVLRDDGAPPDVIEAAEKLEALQVAIEEENAKMPNSGIGTLAVEQSRKDGQLKRLALEVERWGEGVKTIISKPSVLSQSHARWRWDWATSTHTIAVQDDIADCARLTCVTEEEREHGIAFAEQVIRHECYHARLTDRDQRIIRQSVDFFGIGAQMFNLWEDARIEDEARLVEGVPFDWFRWHQHPEEGFDDPLQMFQYLTYCEEDEGHLAIARSKWAGPETVEWRGKTHRTIDLIEAFNWKARTARTTRHLWAPLREWLEVFGGYEEPPPELRHFPLPLSKVPGEPEDGEEGEDEGESVEGSGKGKPKGKGKSGKDKDRTGGHGYGGLTDEPTVGSDLSKASAPMEGTLQKGDKTEQVSTDRALRPFINPDEGRCDLSTARSVEVKLMRMLTATDASRTRSSVSGQRLHVGNLISQQADAFKSIVGRKGKRRVCLIMDMSGSMGGDFAQHGGAFVQAVMSLHQKGLFHADVWLSGGGKAYKLPPTTNTATIRALVAHHGCESIDATLEKAKADVLAADTVLIYTDGELTDGDVQAGEWRARGVDLIGVATGNADIAEALRRHFHKGFVAPNPARLASRIAQYVLAHP